MKFTDKDFFWSFSFVPSEASKVEQKNVSFSLKVLIEIMFLKASGNQILIINLHIMLYFQTKSLYNHSRWLV